MRLTGSLMAAALALSAVTPAAAQAPECTGISDVSNFDGGTVRSNEYGSGPIERN